MDTEQEKRGAAGPRAVRPICGAGVDCLIAVPGGTAVVAGDHPARDRRHVRRAG